jgi:Kef-type K+ transport system membrane component KefB
MSLKEIIPLVFLDIAIVVVAARLMGRLFRRLRQPAVVGEIVAGIVLGPSLLGLLPGDLDTVLFPTDVRPYLSVIAQLGLVLFMFVVGLEVDMALIRRHRRTATTVSLASIALPFGLGVLLAGWLYGAHDVVGGRTVSPPAFALFLGVAMSITAFPVLARILTERGIHRLPVGVLALACAAIDDVVAWSLLALVIAVAVGGTLGGVGTIVGLTALYAAVMFLVVRPLLRRLVTGFRAAGRLTPDALAIVLVGVLISAFVTEEIGVHAIFGAFVFGAIVPRDEPGLIREVLQRIEQVSVLLLLPVFFVVAGLQVNIAGIGARGLVELLAILAVAIGGKFVGAAAAARLSGVKHRQAVALGVLMNTRGLTEIVILQVGAQLGVLDQELFTLMVVMALVTTVMTEPLLRRLYPDRTVAREIAAAERAELGEPGAFTVLVALPPGRSAADTAGLVALARGLADGERAAGPARLVLCRFLPGHVDPLELASGVGSDLTAIAAAGDELRALGAEVPGARPTVVVRFSPDPRGDLAALARTLPADVVVVGVAEDPETGEETDEAPEPPAVGDAALVTVGLPLRPSDPGPSDPGPSDPGPSDPGPAGPRPFDRAAATVGVLVDRGPAGRAGVRLGALLTASGRELAVGGVDERWGGRRLASVTAALARHGVATTELGSPADVDVLLVPDGPAGDAVANVDHGATVLRIRPAATDLDDDLDEALGRVTGPDRSAANGAGAVPAPASTARSH